VISAAEDGPDDRGARLLTADPHARRILLVEDDEDTRQLLAIALEAQGYGVIQARDADEGLAALRGGGFRMILTDYDLPGKTGAAMLREAGARGLVDGAATVVVTAHPEPEGVDDATLVRKPLDLEKFLLQVRRIFDAKPPSADGHRESEGPKAGAERVGLRLYISADSTPSLVARRNMERLLARLRAGEIDFEVFDLAVDPAQGDKDHIIFTPTLVKHRPYPRAWIVGDLADPTVVTDLFHMCGIEPVP
jgi:CheY-like chemotaxis protein